MMTDALRRAVDQAQTLPVSEQDRLAALLVNELLNLCPVEAVEANALLDIEQLAQAAVEEDRRGATRSLEDVLQEYHDQSRFLGR